MMQKPFGVAIVGGSGYGGGELLRLLALHPSIEVCSVVSRTHAGSAVHSVHTHLTGVVDLTFSAALETGLLKRYTRAAVVLALPSGLAGTTLAGLPELPPSTVVVDLSGDLRLRSPESHAQYYPEVPFEGELRRRFQYGLTEVARSEIASATHITNPGCLATAAILALAPLTALDEAGVVVLDAKTGTSGAGREPQASMHHPSRYADFTAYKPLTHRHEPEILQCLGAPFSQRFQCMFVPHLLPVSRGIFVTAYITLARAESAAGAAERFREVYHTSPCIRIRTAPPRLVDVVGTNFCDLFVTSRGTQLVVMSALDNLGKGMAGQAIQNLNLTFGLPEQAGVVLPGLGPV